MATGTLKAFGVLACGVLWASGCTPAQIDGTVGDHEYGKIKTAVFDTYEDDYGSYLALSFYDQDFSCDQLKTAADNGTAPTVDGSDEAVGAFQILLARYEGNYLFSAVSDPGTYNVFDIYDVSDYGNLEEGDLIAIVYSDFYIDPEEPLVFDTGEVGSVTVDKVDLEKSVAGTFSVTLSDSGAELSGEFKAEPCDAY